MNKIAIAFSTKDRVDLSRRSIEPLLQPSKFDLYIVDGSSTDEGKRFPWDFHKGHSPLRIVEGIRGGADAAIAHNLTYLLNRPEEYSHVGLVENDVLLADGWFERTMALFDLGAQDDLQVGAVSARCYADRILVQRPGYALMHNLGAGMVIFTRQAARCVLDHFRTGWSTDNRAVFSILSGIDIGRYWAFKGNEHWLCADWGFDRALAANGLASLALTPSPCEMIGQVPPLADQGLAIVDKEIDEFRNDEAFDTFAVRTRLIREGRRTLPDQHRHRDQQGEIIFAHQISDLGVNYSARVYLEGWRLKWFQGFGPFAYQSVEAGASHAIPIFGPCHILVRAHDAGPAQVKIEDEHSGFEATPTLQAGIMMAAFVPSGQQYRTVRVTALDPGAIFHGVQCTCPQPRVTSWSFDWSALPRV